MKIFKRGGDLTPEQKQQISEELTESIEAVQKKARELKAVMESFNMDGIYDFDSSKLPVSDHWVKKDFKGRGM